MVADNATRASLATRAYLVVLLTMHACLFGLSLCAPAWLFAHFGLKDAATDVGFADFVASFHRFVLSWAGLAAVGLNSTSLHFVALLSVVSQGVSLLALLLPTGFANGEPASAVPASVLLVLVVFGAVALFRDGARPRLGQPPGTSPYLDVAVALVLFLQGTFAFALHFNYDAMVLSGFVQPSESLTLAGVQGLGEFVGLSLATASVAMAVFYFFGADNDDTRLVVACTAAALAVHAMVLQDKMQLFRFEYLPATGFSVALFLFLLSGIRMTLKTPMWEKGGVFQLRNALLVLTCVWFFFWLQTVLFMPIALKQWLPPARVSGYLTSAAADIVSHYSLSQAAMYFGLWAAWATGHRDGCRVALLAIAMGAVVQAAFFAMHSEVIGLDNTALLLQLLFQAAVFTLASKSLSDDLGGQWGAWVRGVFAWSHTPIQIGLYVHVIVRTALGLLLALSFRFQNRIMVSSEGVSQWHAPEVRIFAQVWGWHLIISGVALYLTARVAGRAFGRTQLWIGVGFLCISASSTAVLRTNPANGLLPVSWLDAAVWAVVLAASLISFHFDSLQHQGRARRKRSQ